MRKWNIPLTYAPKIAGVLDGSIRQTIRVGRKFSTGDQVSFHGWEGKPYRSKWSFRTPYMALTEVIPVEIETRGIMFPNGPAKWDELMGLALLDGIDPPTGQELKNVLIGMHPVRIGERIPAQIIRW